MLSLDRRRLNIVISFWSLRMKDRNRIHQFESKRDNPSFGFHIVPICAKFLTSSSRKEESQELLIEFLSVPPNTITSFSFLFFSLFPSVSVDSVLFLRFLFFIMKSKNVNGE